MKLYYVKSNSWEVKCRLQSQSSLHVRSPGKEEFHYRSTWDGVKQILRKDGLLGFTRCGNAKHCVPWNFLRNHL